MNLKYYGFHPEMMPENAAGIPARVTAVHRDRFEVVCEEGAGFARLKNGEYRLGKEPVPTTGDFVLLDWQEFGESRILKTLPRKTYLSRLDPSSSGCAEQAVAANFDVVLVLQSLDQALRPRRLERYLTLAWQSGAVPVVVLTKSDLAQDPFGQRRAAEQLAPGAAVFAVSAKDGTGLDRLSDYFTPGNTVVLLGPSGVGKSSLVNALAGEPIAQTNEIRQKDSRGRHTTTRRQLFLLKSGVLIIDSPGMRELGMWDIREGADKSFSDVEQYLGRCRFRDCRHQDEPGCAILEAIRGGALPPDRWQAYLRLNAEAHFSKDKAGYLRGKQKFRKEIAKGRRAQKGEGGYQHKPCMESFACRVCGAWVTPEDAGSQHRNHCPQCLSSVHVDVRPGDRASLCKGIQDPIGVWVRKNGEWAVIHRCRLCGALSSNRIAADDNPALLLSIATKPLAAPPFPLWQLGQKP